MNDAVRIHKMSAALARICNRSHMFNIFSIVLIDSSTGSTLSLDIARDFFNNNISHDEVHVGTTL